MEGQGGIYKHVICVALGSPKLPVWSASDGDPCGESSQGVTCTGSSITSIFFNAANLGGQLGSLGKFTSITEMQFSCSWLMVVPIYCIISIGVYCIGNIYILGLVMFYS